MFELGDFTGHSGKLLHYKIECDALTDDDLETLAWLVSKRYQFYGVLGIPRGGARFAAHLENYAQRGRTADLPFLLVDDVLTTGGSMAKARVSLGDVAIQGVVIFARDTVECPQWIDPIFRMWR